MPDPSVTLITGASRGVGEALVLRLAHDGRTVAALSRNAEKLTSLAAQPEATEGTINPKGTKRIVMFPTNEWH